MSSSEIVDGFRLPSEDEVTQIINGVFDADEALDRPPADGRDYYRAPDSVRSLPKGFLREANPDTIVETHTFIQEVDALGQDLGSDGILEEWLGKD